MGEPAICDPITEEPKESKDVETIIAAAHTKEVSCAKPAYVCRTEQVEGELEDGAEVIIQTPPGQRSSSSNADQVLEWLSQTVHLCEYYALLVENGFDSLDRLADVTMEDLTHIGVVKLGRQKSIIKHARALSSDAEATSF